ncbi:bifunctional precorrin-2 dehydrogenase/sirohydrochlorin ferrochelatase [Rhodohalobacter sp. SW132]|uniref:precorrin-2 dehydrogenase/sirohydrochlorin ferrochelatase family protein n=1 Tax=Rhodohalobacter sp. SW132 TaxID=2293433 RepID=UPI000E26B0E3|nr:bifunctional precorrin-2 dehydrogenase/sirohydrochlorin ferrochelatase [Rhodohalobacter sp. SW132]REL33242.1 bifunctional precorrin-2 dehydrogenase/sirohydrochlorin ferrochelatase [Rhodohalobacter sp. SW132]
MHTYPIYLTQLHKKKTVLIGGDHEAERKAGELLERHAKLTVISPKLSDTLRAWADEGRFEWINRRYHEGDLEGAFLVIAAQFEADENKRIFNEAEERGILVNVMDDIPHANFSFGSIVKRGPLTLSISTSGAAPTLAVRLRERFEKEFGEEYDTFLTLMHKLRDPMSRHYDDFETRKNLWYQLIDSDALDLFRENKPDEAIQRIREILGDPVVDDVLAAEAG